MINRGKLKILLENPGHVISSTMNFTRSHPVLKPKLRGEKPVSTRLNFGAGCYEFVYENVSLEVSRQAVSVAQTVSLLM